MVIDIELDLNHCRNLFEVRNQSFKQFLNLPFQQVYCSVGPLSAQNRHALFPAVYVLAFTARRKLLID